MASGDLHHYDPDQVSVSLGGIPITGWADGEFVTIERESDAFSDVVGTDGEVTRSKTNDDRATIVFKLMQSSSSNILLSALYNLDKNTPAGAGVGPLMVRDAQGTSLYVAEKAWISRAPSVSFDRTATSREWTIRCAKLVEVHGGN
jgi:hypothetical protein